MTTPHEPPATRNPFVLAEWLAFQRLGDGVFPPSYSIGELRKLCDRDTEFYDALAEYRRYWRLPSPNAKAVRP